jgi:hypothetical protein
MSTMSRSWVLGEPNSPGCLDDGSLTVPTPVFVPTDAPVRPAVGAAGGQHSRRQGPIRLLFWPRLRLSEDASPGGLHGLMAIGWSGGRPQNACVGLSNGRIHRTAWSFASHIIKF